MGQRKFIALRGRHIGRHMGQRKFIALCGGAGSDLPSAAVAKNQSWLLAAAQRKRCPQS